MTTIINPLPYDLVNGATADATQVMADFDQIVSNVNAGAAGNGNNSDITALSGLTSPIPTSAGGVPTGAILPYAAITPPAGWLYCDGSAVSRSTYATLFALIGTVYGTGDGSTTFNVPDMRGRVPAGYDQGNATGRLTDSESGGVSASSVANSGGEQAHALVTAELASHQHGINDPGHTHTVSDPEHAHGNPSAGLFAVVAGGGGTVAGGSAFDVTTANATASASTGITNSPAVTDISTVAAGSGTAHNTVQPTLVVGYIIKF